MKERIIDNYLFRIKFKLMLKKRKDLEEFYDRIDYT